MAKSFPKNFIEIPVSKLVKADWNYKEDNDELKEKLKANIMRNGQIENIIIRELETGYFEIVNGNHRFDALLELGFGTIVAYNLGSISLPQAQRIAIETNETRFESNTDKLAKLLQEINLEFPEDDLNITMPFNLDELSDLLHLNLPEIDQAPFDLEEDGYNQPPPEQAKTKLGDLYEINGHRLLCGDSTNSLSVKTLMNGNLAHMVFTDPPYNISYVSFNNDRAGGKGKDWNDDTGSTWEDKMSDADYIEFLYQFLLNAKENSIEWAHYYVWHATTYYRELLDAFIRVGIPYDKVPIQWVKQNAPLSWVRYKRKSEPCIFAGKGAVNGAGADARWFGPNNEVNIWQIDRDSSSTYVHPTQKPLALAARGLTNSSQEGEIVLDLFLGSGTTLITSDKMNRICYGMEYEPKFCDVIVLRYIKYCEDNAIDYSVKLNGVSIDKDYFDPVPVTIDAE